MWRITPLHRRELAGTMDRDAPPSLPDGVSREEAQLSDAGVGPPVPPPVLGPDRRGRRAGRRSSWTASPPTSTGPRRPSSPASSRCTARRVGWRSVTSTSCACPGPGTARSGSWNARRRRSGWPRSTATWRRARSSSGSTPRTPASGSPSSPGPAAATSFRGSCTSGSTWPRRSSSTCGPRSWSGWPSSPAVACRAGSTPRRRSSTTGPGGGEGPSLGDPRPGACSTSCTTRR